MSVDLSIVKVTDEGPLGLRARVQLDHDARGRPLLFGSAPHLSVAHSGDFVACAVSGRRVGVDIERSDRAEADEFARRCAPRRSASSLGS